MAVISAKAKTRLIEGIKRFKPIVTRARDKDVNESDTVAIIMDIMSEVFGYDKYSEITTEFAIKKTYCDLAIKIDGQPCLLLEAKAAGLNLKEQHIKQAVDYGSNSGIEWVVLTNSVPRSCLRFIFLQQAVQSPVRAVRQRTQITQPDRLQSVRLLTLCRQ